MKGGNTTAKIILLLKSNHPFQKLCEYGPCLFVPKQLTKFEKNNKNSLGFHTWLTAFDNLPCCSCPGWTWLGPVGLQPERTVSRTRPPSPMTETAWGNTQQEPSKWAKLKVKNWVQKTPPKLTPFQILAGSMSVRTCCKREPAIHWSYTAHTAAVDFHRFDSTVPNSCTQPEWCREIKLN